MINRILLLSLGFPTILFIGGCTSPCTKVGVSGPLRPEDRTQIHTIAISVNHGAFKLRSSYYRGSATGSVVVGTLLAGPIGGVLAGSVEMSMAQSKAEKEERVFAQTLLDEFSLSETLFRQMTLTLEEWDDINIRPFTSEQAGALHADAVLVFDIEEWGIDCYPKVEGGCNTVGGYMLVTASLRSQNGGGQLWSYTLKSFYEERDPSEMNSKTQITEYFSILLKQISEKTANRLFNS